MKYASVSVALFQIETNKSENSQNLSEPNKRNAQNSSEMNKAEESNISQYAYNLGKPLNQIPLINPVSRMKLNQ